MILNCHLSRKNKFGNVIHRHNVFSVIEKRLAGKYNRADEAKLNGLAASTTGANREHHSADYSRLARRDTDCVDRPLQPVG